MQTVMNYLINFSAGVKMHVKLVLNSSKMLDAIFEESNIQIEVRH